VSEELGQHGIERKFCTSYKNLDLNLSFGLTCCVMLDKSLNLSEPQCSQEQNGPILLF
jgi:hypothetical protein